jgi:transposase-like protein
MKTRRRYDRDFKISIVAELEGGKPPAQDAREHGIHPSLHARWREELAENPEKAFSGNGVTGGLKVLNFGGIKMPTSTAEASPLDHGSGCSCSLQIVTNIPYILTVAGLPEYHSFSPIASLARSSTISTYCRTRDLLISSSEAIFSGGIPSL